MYKVLSLKIYYSNGDIDAPVRAAVLAIPNTIPLKLVGKS